MLHKTNDTSETVCPCTQHSTEADDSRASQRTTPRTGNRPTVLSDQEPVLQRISFNADANVAEVTNPSHPTITDEDGDEAQEFYIEFGGKMFQYNPKILTVEHFLTILNEKEKSTSSVNASIINDPTASPSINRTTSHPSPRNTRGREIHFA